MKRLLMVLLALAVVGSLSAQTISLDPAKLDFSKAKLSVAGPSDIYVRSIWYGNVELSVLLKYDGANGVFVYGPYLAAQKLIQDSYEVSYGRMEKFGDNLIAIYDLMFGNVAYSGRLKWDGGAKMILDSYWQTTPPETCEQEIAKLQSEVDKGNEYKTWATKVNAELETTKTQLREANVQLVASQKSADQARADASAAQKAADQARADLAAAQRAAGSGAAVVRPWRTAPGLAGILAAKPVTTGSWTLTEKSLVQTDGSQKFAKFAVPFAQNADHTLFGFTAKAGATGWVGFGLHFFASGAKRADAYGFGKSYLVWLTRDEGYYRNPKAYVQLYQSSDDITMVQIASANIGLDLTQPVNTEVQYHKDTRTVEIYVNGALAITQKVDPIASGDSIAARTLGGGVEASAFYVKTY